MLIDPPPERRSLRSSAKRIHLSPFDIATLSRDGKSQASASQSAASANTSLGGSISTIVTEPDLRASLRASNQQQQQQQQQNRNPLDLSMLVREEQKASIRASLRASVSRRLSPLDLSFSAKDEDEPVLLNIGIAGVDGDNSDGRDLDDEANWLGTNTSFRILDGEEDDTPLSSKPISKVPEPSPRPVAATTTAKMSFVITADVKKRKVSFTHVQVREYGMILGDHPCSRNGLPVTIDWKYQDEESMSMEMYRYMRAGAYGQHGQSSKHGARRLSSAYRREYLMKLEKYSTKDFLKVIEECTEIQESRMKNAGIKDAALFKKLLFGGEAASGAVLAWGGNMAGFALDVANFGINGTMTVANTAYSGTKAVAHFGVNGTKVMANTAINGTMTVANFGVNGTKVMANTAINGTKTIANFGVNGTKAVATLGVNGTKVITNTAINGTKAVANFGVNGTKVMANTAIHGTKTVANMGVNAVGTGGKVLLHVSRSSGKGVVKAVAVPYKTMRSSLSKTRRTSMGPGAIVATATL